MPNPTTITYRLSPEEEQSVVAHLLLRDPTGPDPTAEDVTAFVGSEFHRVLADTMRAVDQRALELAFHDPEAARDLHAARLATVKRHVEAHRQKAAEVTSAKTATADGN